MNFFSFSIVCSLLLLSACNNTDKKSADTASKSAVIFDFAGMDTIIKPGDNFFEYANGKWMKEAIIPDDQSGWGSFYILYDQNQKNLQQILEEAAKNNAIKNSLEQKLGDYYTSGMDTNTIEKLAADPLQPILAKIDAIKDYKELMAYAAEANAYGDDNGFIAASVSADEKNSALNILSFYQTGLSLPEKDYYTRNDSAAKAARGALLKYASKLFVLTGTEQSLADKKANEILMLETEFAKSHRSPVELRDPQKNYNKYSIVALNKVSPNINWPQVISKMNVKLDSVNIGQPEFYIALSKLLPDQPIEIWKTKVKYEYIANHASLLSKAFTNAKFDYDKIFSGQKKDSDRWKKMVNRLDDGLGELLGQVYVKKYFAEEAKKRMDELVNNLQKAFEVRIKKLDWMSDSTKQRAVSKLNIFLKKIGYPSKWKNFDDVTIDKANFFANAKSVQLHNRKELINKIGKPVDRSEWGLSPPTVNAYYNPTNNEIVFPAGILQFPFFNPIADDAVNYGAIGMVIGHEMTHGFDDQGSQYDEKGNMQNWWGKEDAIKFKAKTGGVVKLYNSFTILDSLHVNGELTLGENLADIGGLAIAYDAFKLTTQGQGSEKINGFTPDQRFFLGNAQVWRLINRVETMRVRIATDPHSPEMYRVNGPLMNFDPFYAAFEIKEGDKMFLKTQDRVKIW